MAQFPIPKSMKAPGDRRPDIWRQGVLQIWVTRACDLSCIGCTQGSNLRGKPGFMTPEQFEVACQSLEGYFGVVGVFGGNPTLHPKFAELCEILKKYVPFEQRGLWSNNLHGYGKLCRETFNPRFSNLNVHGYREAFEEMKRDWPESFPKGLGEASYEDVLKAGTNYANLPPSELERLAQRIGDSRHSPPFVAMQDVVPDERERWKLIANCDVNQRWSAMMCVFRGELRAYFCELAGAQAMLHANEPDYPDLGLPVTPGWWKKSMEAFDAQVRFHCHACGVPLRGAGDFATLGRVEQVSTTHASIYKPKEKDRQVQLVTDRAVLGRVPRMTDYIENAQLKINTKKPVIASINPNGPRIDAIITCVGPVYASYLRRSMPLWLDTLDTITVVTSPDDEKTIDLCEGFNSPRIRLVKTDLFYQHGAHFNKGAALSHALSFMAPQEWVLHVDSDMTAEPDWRSKAEPLLKKGHLHGANRYYESGELIPDWPFACGFFQLFHIDDPRAWYRPLWEPCWGHAGNYDANFLERWPEDRRRDLKIKLIHYGEPRSNWFGTGFEDPEKEQKSREEMRKLHEIGLREALKMKPLAVPKFKLRVRLQPGTSVEWVHEVLEYATREDPFEIAISVGGPKPGALFIPATVTAKIAKERIRMSLERA